jgi:hypothetical protein
MEAASFGVAHWVGPPGAVVVVVVDPVGRVVELLPEGTVVVVEVAAVVDEDEDDGEEEEQAARRTAATTSSPTLVTRGLDMRVRSSLSGPGSGGVGLGGGVLRTGDAGTRGA